MADYFTLDPYYERYELGVVAMEYKTVYGRPTEPTAIALAACAIGLLVALGFIYFRTRSAVLSDTAIVWLLGIGIGVPLFAVSMGWRLWLYLRTRHKLRKLRLTGILLNGILLGFEIIQIRYRSSFNRSPDPLPFAQVIYQFTTLDNQQLRGEQRRVLYEDWKRPIPTAGTPIRVLYADPETYVML